ncbi:MAG: histidinol dehydrogenase [Robiginitalea sp.]
MELLRYPDRTSWEAILKRPYKDLSALEDIVRNVFSEVKDQGDAALESFTKRFDGVELSEIRVPSDSISDQADKISLPLKEAIEVAYENIYAFHAAQKTPRVEVNMRTGVQCWQEKRPIERVGLYIPGGTAPLFSTVLMLGIPAQIAGCSEVVLCSPPNKNGQLHPAILYAAQRCGISIICRIGGIQAIAGMTYGTQSVPKVDKIFGPGNQYVTVAKQWASRLDVAIDMPAGPSELMVVADDTAVPEFIASDLLSQAEHGTDSQVLLVSDKEAVLEAVSASLEAQIGELPREQIARQAMANSRGVLLRSREELAEIVNAYAPEHLIICHRDEEFLLREIYNAGSVFLGNYTPESAGDYASGTNHTLPTNGFARQYSGVNLDSYTKSITYQRIDPDGLQDIGPAIEIMARAEGLEAHAKAVGIRLSAIKSNE